MTLPRIPYPDRPLEESFFPDRGCGLWSRCLTCPLMSCVHDQRERNAAFRGHRDRMLYRRYLEEQAASGHQRAVAAVAEEFDVSTRTVQRVIARNKKETS